MFVNSLLFDIFKKKQYKQTMVGKQYILALAGQNNIHPIFLKMSTMTFILSISTKPGR